MPDVVYEVLDGSSCCWVWRWCLSAVLS